MAHHPGIRLATDRDISTALPGKDIGLEELANGIWRVYFC